MSAPSPSRPQNLREAHCHLAMHGRALSMLKLHDCAGPDECLELVAAEARRMNSSGAPASAWLLGCGARVEAWSPAHWPSLERLDAVTTGRACCLMSFDHHAVLANTQAMTAAGLNEGSTDPSGGVICRDTTGRANGVLLEAAATLVWNSAPEPTPEDRREHVRSGLRDLAAHGFTEVHDLLSPVWLGPLLAGLFDAGELPVSVALYVHIDKFLSCHADAGRWERDGVRLMGAKIFADGTLNSATALMLSDFASPLPGLARGKLISTPAQLADAMVTTSRAGRGLAVHAIGDGAVRETLNAWERSRHERGPRGSLRIEHAEVIDAADVPRFARLGVVASIQPCHLLADVEALNRQLPHRLGRVLPLRELIDTGCTPGELLVFGSDTPIVRPDPQDSIQAAVYRRRPGAPDSEAIALEQAISTAEAWGAFAAKPA